MNCLNNRNPANSIFQTMDFPHQNHHRQMSKSVSQYEKSNEKSPRNQLILQNNFFQIQSGFHHPSQDLFYNTEKKPKKSTRRNKRSERYLKQKAANFQKDENEKVNHERYFSVLNKMNQQSISNQHISKALQTSIEKNKNPKLIQIAIRYGMYNERPKNIYLSIEKRPRNPCPTQKHQQQSELMNTQSKILLPRKKSVSKNYESVENNKISLGTLGIDSNHDKSMSLMLERKNITKKAKETQKQRNNSQLEIIERNKIHVQVPSVKKNKMQRKIQFFVHEDFDIDLTTIKAKLNNNTCESRNQQTELLKVRQKQKSKISQKEISSVSQQIHLPFQFNSNKHTSFNDIKKVPVTKEKQLKIKSKIEAAQIIPESITFKKEKTQNNKFDNKNPYLLKQTKKQPKSLNQVPHEEQMENFSILQRPKTHKENRINTEAVVLRKSRKQLFSVKPPQFTFVFDSKDHNHIAQYLTLNGWGQYVATKLNNIYKLKWVNNPVASEILNMKEGQFYNHFHKSFELTSKSFLNSNLKANRHFLLTHEFFPDTYDIGNEAEKQEFVENFMSNVMIMLLEKMVVHCFMNSRDGNQVKTCIEELCLFSQTEDFFKQTQEDKKLQNQFFNAMEFENYKNPDDKFKLNIFLVILSLKFYQKERRRYDIDCKEKKHNFLMFRKGEFEKNYDMLELYSQQEDVGRSNSEIGLYSYHYATPSDLLLKLLIREYSFFSKIHKWSYGIESNKLNVSNIWIVKPSSNARGNGIYLQKNMNSMLKSAKDIQSRIVQKYLERPLLFKNTKYSYLNNHKFDLRQWVLLKSLDPLEIYMFSHFYIRLASEKYQINSIDNNKVHLTNFSANKEFFKSIQHSIVNSDDFCEFLRGEHSIEWQTDLKPKIRGIIVKSIQACQEKLQTSSYGTCFELLGYDILIDENMTPWLIEVNMSPACEQRTEWLSDYLKNMNEGLLDIIIPETYLPNRSIKQRKQFWQKIYFEEYFFTGKDFDPKLQIVSVNYQQKQKLSKQAQQGKSKSSLANSMSPTKFKRRSRNQSSINAECIQKFSQSPYDKDNSQAKDETEMFDKKWDNTNSNSFVINDFVEESIMEIEKISEITDNHKHIEQDMQNNFLLDDINDKFQS